MGSIIPHYLSGCGGFGGGESFNIFSELWEWRSSTQADVCSRIWRSRGVSGMSGKELRWEVSRDVLRARGLVTPASEVNFRQASLISSLSLLKLTKFWKNNALKILLDTEYTVLRSVWDWKVWVWLFSAYGINLTGFCPTFMLLCFSERSHQKIIKTRIQSAFRLNQRYFLRSSQKTPVAQ